MERGDLARYVLAAALLFPGCDQFSFGNAKTAEAPTVAPELPKPEPRISYSPEQRAKVVGQILDAENALSWLNPSAIRLARRNHGLLSDTEIEKYLSSASEVKDYGRKWNLEVTIPESKPLKIETHLVYGHMDRLTHIVIKGNLLDGGQLPHIVPFIDSSTGKLVADKEELQKVARTIFNLPPTINWFTGYKVQTVDKGRLLRDVTLIVPPILEPQFQGREVIGVLGMVDNFPEDRIKVEISADGEFRFTAASSIFDPTMDSRKPNR